MAICSRCGQKIEDPNAGHTVCYACYLDSLLPAWYERAEEYRYPCGLPIDERTGQVDWDRVNGILHKNRTRKPPTGVPLLDSTPIRPSELGLPPGLIPRGRV